jgi:membrane-bound ClpP family serine protease
MGSDVEAPRKEKRAAPRSRNRMWAAPVLARYILMQIPVLALLGIVLMVSRESEFIPTWPVLILLIGWAIKDIVVYPSVWRSYDPEQQKLADPLIGAVGTAKTDLDPKGTVLVGSELWQAKTAASEMIIRSGDPIEVVSKRGLMLIVRPVE